MQEMCTLDCTYTYATPHTYTTTYLKSQRGIFPIPSTQSSQFLPPLNSSYSLWSVYIKNMARTTPLPIPWNRLNEACITEYCDRKVLIFWTQFAFTSSSIIMYFTLRLLQHSHTDTQHGKNGVIEQHAKNILHRHHSLLFMQIHFVHE